MKNSVRTFLIIFFLLLGASAQASTATQTTLGSEQISSSGYPAYIQYDPTNPMPVVLTVTP